MMAQNGSSRNTRLDSINQVCPWSGKPVAAASLTLYRGRVVGFCNPGCREKFETAVAMFETKRAGEGVREGN